MRQCETCGEQFETFQAKANHVRWKHKPQAYTEDGLKRIKRNAQASVVKRYGVKTTITETRTCNCGTQFVVTFSPQRKAHVRQTCSKACAARRKQTPSMSAKKSSSMKIAFAENPEVCMRGIRAMMNASGTRSSSKAERALAQALQAHGFKRHKQVTVDGLTFDVDIVSLDDSVWVESDGEWHFRQVHAGHDFQKTRLRDDVEEREAIKRNVLLVRVNNQTTSIEDQVDFIIKARSQWDGAGCVMRLGYE